MRVLIADDHEIARLGIRRKLLETERFDLIEDACNGTELFAALQTTPFDWLIMDVSMPDFNPLEQIRFIRKEYPKLYILVVSAYDDYAYVQGLLSAGVQGYHLKGQPSRELVLAIEQILAGEIWVSSPLINKILAKQTHSNISLSARLLDIAYALSRGLSNKDIAEELSLSIKTIENHLTHLYQQINVNNRLEAVKYLHDHPQILGQHGQTLPTPVPKPLNLTASERSIVVVDDNPRFRKQLVYIIGRNFPMLTIYEAAEWEELQPIVQQVQPALIFMDVVLGKEDGIRLTRRIKQENCPAKVVLITAYPDREFHRLGISAGAIALIDKKDLDSATIKQIIADVIG
jgi:DNA-binding NarL/FixJ family response regulator